MNIKFFVPTFVLFLFISCEKIIDPLESPNELLGIWKETYTWKDEVNCIHIDDDDSHCIKHQLSVLEIKESLFEVTIFDSSGLSEAKHTGSYRMEEDTIQFILESDRSIHKFRYDCNHQHLTLIALPIQFSDSLLAFPLSSLLWGNATNKHNGTFNKTTILQN